MAQDYPHKDLTFLPCMPRRRLSRKIPLTVNAPLHFIASDTLIIPQALEAPFTHGHGEVPTTITHNIDQLRRGHDVRLNFIACLRPLFVRICIPDETGFAPGRADEAESKSISLSSTIEPDAVASERYSRDVGACLNQRPSHVPHHCFVGRIEA